MKVIYKYPLELRHSNSLQLPKEANIISCQLQYNQICLWAEVDPNAEIEQRRFCIYGTGMAIPPANVKHIASIQQGAFVWHVYENFYHS